jgi:hypothetical protein
LSLEPGTKEPGVRPTDFQVGLLRVTSGSLNASVILKFASGLTTSLL